MTRLSCCIIGLASLAWLAGCNAPPAAPEDEWLVKSIDDDMVDNAILTQHSLYPYHFLPDSPCLNDLGSRDLSLLVSHFKSCSGNLNVNRGDASEELYNARLKTVAQRLSLAGVDSSRVKIGEGLPGGDGITTDRVVANKEKEKEVRQAASSGYPSGPSNSGKMGEQP